MFLIFSFFFFLYFHLHSIFYGCEAIMNFSWTLKKLNSDLFMEAILE